MKLISQIGMHQLYPLKRFLPYCIFYILVNIFSWNIPFFWDTIQLGSKHAHYFLESNFSSLILPQIIDSGHFPLFGLYLAFFWKTLGKSLFVSHLVMLPFLIGIAWQYYKLSLKFLPQQFIHYTMILLVLEPTFLAQSLLVGPDVVLLFLFLLSLNYILEEKKKLLSVSLIFLALISMRGMMAVVAVFIINIFFSRIQKKEKLNWKIILPYVPSGIAALSWIIYHHLQTGWTGHAPSWAGAFETVGFTGKLKNAGILIWRILDFGRVFLWGFVPFLVFTYWRKYRKFSSEAIMVLAIVLVPLLVYLPTFLRYSNLIAHRYIMIVFVTMGIAAVYFMQALPIAKWRNLIFGIVAAGLISGHFWIYPDKIAKGWDASLAYLPYFELRHKMIDYIHEKELDPAQIGTAFPNVDGTKFTDLDDSQWKFAEKYFSKNNYIFQSNVFNDFSDEELEALKKDWHLEKEFIKNRVYVRLYKKP